MSTNGKALLHGMVALVCEIAEDFSDDERVVSILNELFHDVEDLARATALMPEERMEVIRQIGAARLKLVGRIPSDAPVQDFVAVRWCVPSNPEAIRVSHLSARSIRRATFDGSTEGRSAASVLAREICSELGDAQMMLSPVVRILSPDRWAGLYEVAVSRRTVEGKERLGFLAYEVEENRNHSENAVRRFVDPSAVLDCYDVISTVCGDILGSPKSDHELAAFERMRELFDNGTFHGLGHMARDAISGKVGVLLVRAFDKNDRFPDGDTLDAFAAETGFVAQCCDGLHNESGLGLVVFVPLDKIHFATIVSDRLEGIELDQHPIVVPT